MECVLFIPAPRVQHSDKNVSFYFVVSGFLAPFPFSKKAQEATQMRIIRWDDSHLCGLTNQNMKSKFKLTPEIGKWKDEIGSGKTEGQKNGNWKTETRSVSVFRYPFSRLSVFPLPTSSFHFPTSSVNLNFDLICGFLFGLALLKFSVGPSRGHENP